MVRGGSRKRVLEYGDRKIKEEDGNLTLFGKYAIRLQDGLTFERIERPVEGP